MNKKYIDIICIICIYKYIVYKYTNVVNKYMKLNNNENKKKKN